MSVTSEIKLTDQQVDEIKRLVSTTRQGFGVHPNVPIGSDIKMILEKKGILLCEFPFCDSVNTHTYANITWFKTETEDITFIGLNTSNYYDEQVFALAHEIYHYTTRTGKAYMPEMDYEDKVVEKKADRFAAELLLPEEALKNVIREEVEAYDLKNETNLKVLRFVAKVQCDWWLPYQAIVNRLYEEDTITPDQYYKFYELECRDTDCLYRRILRSTDNEISELLNKKTKKIGVSNRVLDTIISNYEDGYIDEDEFVELLALFDKKPEDFGFALVSDDEEETVFFEDEDS